jgi:hypothetical protein
MESLTFFGVSVEYFGTFQMQYDNLRSFHCGVTMEFSFHCNSEKRRTGYRA